MLCLVGIGFQDFRERQVYWLLFLFLAILLSSIFYCNTEEPLVFLFHIGLNLLLVSLLVLLVWMYTRIILKKKFLGHSIGLGDILFFIALAVGFPTVTFLVLMVNSLIFSLLGYLILKNKLQPSVPLAGFMAFFLGIVIGYSVVFKTPSLYLF